MDNLTLGIIIAGFVIWAILELLLVTGNLFGIRYGQNDVELMEFMEINVVIVVVIAMASGITYLVIDGLGVGWALGILGIIVAKIIAYNLFKHYSRY